MEVLEQSEQRLLHLSNVRHICEKRMRRGSVFFLAVSGTVQQTVGGQLVVRAVIVGLQVLQAWHEEWDEGETRGEQKISEIIKLKFEEFEMKGNRNGKSNQKNQIEKS